MSKYLVSTVETYRVDTEAEVTRVIEEAKHDGSYELAQYISKRKDIKKNDETYWELSLKKIFNDIKDPISIVEIDYEVN
jgi:hypothetical protein